MSLLPVEPAYRLADRAEDQRWLVTSLWSEQAVGIVGGEPKCCKSFLALDLAVAVAAGIPCLRRFAVPRAGRVLLCAAEDALHIVRRRLEGICAAVGVSLAELDIQVITAPSVRSISMPIGALWPRPSPACSHACSSSTRSCGCIASTRTPAARWCHCWPSCANCSDTMPSPCSSSIMPRRAPDALVPVRPCGSSEFHAWGASNLYLRRNGGPREGSDLMLTVERRAAAAMPTVTLELAQRANALVLEIIERRTPHTSAPAPSTSASLPP
jgi:AAA domain